MDNKKKEKIKKRTGAEVETTRKENFLWRYGEKNNKKKHKEVEKQKKEVQKLSDALLSKAKERLFALINKDDKEGMRVA